MEKDMALDIQNLSKTFEDGADILNDITFSIKKNELVALIGPSGAGKSTILNVITKVTNKTGGKVFVEGREIDEYKNIKEYAKCVGMIRQHFDLVSSLSVLNNVLIGRFNTWSFMQCGNDDIRISLCGYGGSCSGSYCAYTCVRGLYRRNSGVFDGIYFIRSEGTVFFTVSYDTAAA